ncbi:hypothetical protein OH76DRAFT_1419792 [Lentinus brumalis]|uniref:Uncharacterized protein n=1 Tax=Lentinus brumalis TaxID=2498619 RepID=A0A371D3K5_9APHY|nr:hypothetical protein OH76DRAFT_1419792 [Polyporus brumalis]
MTTWRFSEERDDIVSREQDEAEAWCTIEEASYERDRQMSVQKRGTGSVNLCAAIDSVFVPDDDDESQRAWRDEGRMSSVGTMQVPGRPTNVEHHTRAGQRSDRRWFDL